MKINVSHVAKLANLHLTDEEKEKFEKQLSSILEYVEILKEANTSKIASTSQVANLKNVQREDKTFPSITFDQALQNTKSKHNGFFKVKAVFEKV